MAAGSPDMILRYGAYLPSQITAFVRFDSPCLMTVLSSTAKSGLHPSMNFSTYLKARSVDSASMFTSKTRRNFIESRCSSRLSAALSSAVGEEDHAASRYFTWSGMCFGISSSCQLR